MTFEILQSMILNAGHCQFRIVRILDPSVLFVSCGLGKAQLKSHKELRKFAIIMTFCSPAPLSFVAFFSLKRSFLGSPYNRCNVASLSEL